MPGQRLRDPAGSQRMEGRVGVPGGKGPLPHHAGMGLGTRSLYTSAIVRARGRGDRGLDIQTLSHACQKGEDAFRQVTPPQVVAGPRVSALPLADPRVQALVSVPVLFCLLSLRHHGRCTSIDV